jgi:hypothetical protein
MPFSTDLTAPLKRVLLMTGTQTGQTTFTSQVQTIKLTSENFGQKNKRIQPHDFSIEFVPNAANSMRVSWWTDRNATHGVTVSGNPFGYAAFSTMADADDVYTIQKDMPGEQGKTLSISITSDSQVNDRIIGFEVRAGLSDAAAYVGGEF